MAKFTEAGTFRMYAGTTADQITVLNTPSANSDAATVSYVLNAVSGVSAAGSPAAFAPVLTATTTALPAYSTQAGHILQASANGALNINGVTFSGNERILVKNETSTQYNGVYVVTQAGSAGTPWVLTRSSDANTALSFVQGKVVVINAGAPVVGSTTWQLTSSSFTSDAQVDSSAVTFGSITLPQNSTLTAVSVAALQKESKNYNTLTSANNGSTMALNLSLVVFNEPTTPFSVNLTAGSDGQQLDLMNVAAAKVTVVLTGGAQFMGGSGTAVSQFSLTKGQSATLVFLSLTSMWHMKNTGVGS